MRLREEIGITAAMLQSHSPPKSVVRVDRSGSVFIQPGSAPPFPFPVLALPRLPSISVSTSLPPPPTAASRIAAAETKRAEDFRIAPTSNEPTAQDVAQEALKRCRELETLLEAANAATERAEARAMLAAAQYTTAAFDMAQAQQYKTRAARCDAAERDSRAAEAALADVSAQLLKRSSEHREALELAGMQGDALTEWERQQVESEAALVAQRAEMHRLHDLVGEAKIEKELHERAAKHRFFERLLRKPQAMAFRAWKMNAAQVAHEHAIMAKALRHLANLKLADAWQAIRTNGAELARQRALLRKTMDHMVKGALSKGFRPLVNAVLERRHQVALIKRVLKRLDRGKYAAGWRKWKYEVEIAHLADAEKKKQRGIVKGILARLRRGLIAKGWRTWILAAHDAEKKERVTRGILTRLTQGLISQGFRGWKSNAAELTRQTKLCTKFFNHFMRAKVGAGFRGWLENSRELGAQEAQVEATRKRMRGILTRIDNAKLGMGWQKLVELKHQHDVLESVFKRVRNAAVAHAVKTWQTNTSETERKRGIVRRALGHLAKSRESAALRMLHVGCISAAHTEQADAARRLVHAAHEQKRAAIAGQRLHSLAVLRAVRAEIALAADSVAACEVQRDMAWSAEAAARAHSASDHAHLASTLQVVAALRKEIATLEQENVLAAQHGTYASRDAISNSEPMRPMMPMPSMTELSKLPATMQAHKFREHIDDMGAEVERLRRVVRKAESVAAVKAKTTERLVAHVAELSREVERERARKNEARKRQIAAEDEASELHHELRLLKLTSLAVSAFAGHGTKSKKRQGKWGAAHSLLQKGKFAALRAQRGAASTTETPLAETMPTPTTRAGGRFATPRAAARGAMGGANAGTPSAAALVPLPRAAAPAREPDAASVPCSPAHIPTASVRVNRHGSISITAASTLHAAASLPHVAAGASAGANKSRRPRPPPSAAPSRLPEVAETEATAFALTFEAEIDSDEGAGVDARPVAGEAGLMKRRKARRMSSTTMTLHDHNLEGWLLKKSKRGTSPVSACHTPCCLHSPLPPTTQHTSPAGTWQPRYFKTQSHCLLYSKSPGGPFLGGLDIAGSGSSIDAIVLTDVSGATLEALRVTGLDSVGGGGVVRAMELRYDANEMPTATGGGGATPTLSAWNRALVLAAATRA